MPKAGELIAARTCSAVNMPRAPSRGRIMTPGERRRTAGFGMERMRARREDDLVALPAVHARGDLVAHRARWQVDRGFLAEQIGDPLA